MTELVLGPLLRHVDDTSACIWVETEDAATVTLTAGEHHAEAPHLPRARPPLRAGLRRGPRAGIEDAVHRRDRRQPGLAGAGLAVPGLADRHAQHRQEAPAGLRLVPHLGHPRQGGQQAARRRRPARLRAADGRHHRRRRTTTTPTPTTRSAGPTWCCSSATRSTPTRPPRRCRSSSSRAATSRSRPGPSCKDCEEYAHLYKLAWSDPANRWLLSTLPSAMIFDDHDIRDDWNTSQTWKQEMEATDWWHDRIVAGLGVVLGPPAPRQHDARRARRGRDLAADRRARRRRGRVRRHRRCSTRSPSGPTRSPSPTAGATPASFGTRRRLVVVDSRAARVLEPERPLDARRRRDGLARRADARRRRPPAHRHLAAVPARPRPALRRGVQTRRSPAARWGRARRAGSARRCARPLDLEHWAAFQDALPEGLRR